MNPNDPERGRRGEETTDWPAADRPPTGAPGDEESTLPAPATPRNAPPATPPGAPAPPRSFHEETTLDAGQFLRSQQSPPAPAGPSQPPGWPGGPTGPQQPPPPAPGGTPPSFHQQTWPPANQPPPSVVPRAKPGLGSRLAAHRGWLIGGAAALAAVLVVGLVAATGGDDNASDGPPTSAAQVPARPTTTVPATATAAPAPPPSRPPAAPPAPMVAPDALPGLLLPADQINQRMNTSGMTALPLENAPLAGTVNPPHCTGVWGPAYQTTYNGSGFTGLVIQGVHREPAHKVAQAVISFPDPGAAKAFYDKQVADWNACRSSRVTWEFGGNTNDVDVAVPAMTAGVMTVMIVPTNSQTAGQQCERDMALRGNVIVDVRACSPTVGSAGFSIARAIADKIAPAP